KTLGVRGEGVVNSTGGAVVALDLSPSSRQGPGVDQGRQGGGEGPEEGGRAQVSAGPQHLDALGGLRGLHEGDRRGGAATGGEVPRRGRGVHRRRQAAVGRGSLTG